MNHWLKTSAALLFGSAVATAAIVAQAADPKSDQKFCNDVNALNSHLAQLEKVDAHSNVKDVMTTTGHVERDAKEMQKSQQKMSTTAGSQLEGAVNELQQTVMTNVSSKETFAKASEKIRGQAHDALSAGKQVAAESHCM
jgi:hypothetical protein